MRFPPSLPRGLHGLALDKVVLGLLAAAWIVLVIVPLAGVIVCSVLEIKEFTFTSHVDFSPFTEMARSGRWGVIARTLSIAAIVTGINLLIALPFSYWLAKLVKDTGVKTFVLTAAVVPFFLSASARTIVWRPLLSSNGLLNTLLLHVGLIDRPIEVFLFSEASVVCALAVTYFPSMLFPVFLAISLIDDDFLFASEDLGARPLVRAWTIVLPLALPGIVAGMIFTFVPVLGEATIPQLLGGGSVNMLSRSVISALQTMNLNVAAAMCTVVFASLAVLLAGLYLSFRFVGGSPQIKGPAR